MDRKSHYFSLEEMFPGQCNGRKGRLVKDRIRDRIRKSNVRTNIPDPVDVKLIVSPLLCDFGAAINDAEAASALLRFAMAYRIQVRDHRAPLTTPRLCDSLKTVIELLLRHYSDHIPMEPKYSELGKITPPDMLWILVHTAHDSMLHFLGSALQAIAWSCEGTQRGVCTELLYAVVSCRLRGVLKTSRQWRTLQCARARQNGYRSGFQEDPRDLQRVTWRQVLFLLGRTSEWRIENDDYAYPPTIETSF
ncbi:hypothetical protein BD324DRAFT_626658 [Kockovaella imperatae]|uniref:Uncharacterized protein n=1 Tax=Kockovaella imperatae TaxID=4999 RepID=A0A1Y1UGL2_9TREE|nr:hypothetical protein BD324DRAFT_626658 [Kockovaella imperatae]ORX36646.1 hypothetical protein BD324DRAFT_626658 [Kockovaella imperatae]